MNTASRLACAVVLAALATVSTATPATAKGPTDVDVSGPGVDGVHLTYTARADVDAGSLGEASRLYDMWSPGLLEPAPDLTEEELGPRYLLTWSGDPHSGETGTDLVVQHAYPFAEGGAWVEFPPDQELWGAPIAQGWIQTPKLTAELVELGAADDVADPAVAEVDPDAVSVAPEASRDSDDASSSHDVAVWTGAGLAVVLAAGGVVLWRRRLSR
ncbi:hypothetical protein [Nocardioides bizhenqiangii]|uniref:LPXTG cell wall anchor domain-containing protein n=1 Tax=Nocardioides bizhenqiangii TaxID=3095076 RepID=A0ABZ0ZUM9_9ACTN|nr:hypothetical protein [Nocardioides sp. HM61]WQQ27942.1 hypothetical protein SHK19_06825 [Nocardioides sp. HM61]